MVSYLNLRIVALFFLKSEIPCQHAQHKKQTPREARKYKPQKVPKSGSEFLQGKHPFKCHSCEYKAKLQWVHYAQAKKWSVYLCGMDMIRVDQTGSKKTFDWSRSDWI